jgi:hypothetical protein
MVELVGNDLDGVPVIARATIVVEHELQLTVGSLDIDETELDIGISLDIPHML